MAANQDSTGQMLLAQSLEELKPLYQLCREGRLYDVTRWIDEGKPLQAAPQSVANGTRHKTALQIALETGITSTRSSAERAWNLYQYQDKLESILWYKV